MWQQWLNAILGIWVLIISFLGFSAETFTTLLIITGIVIVILGFWGAGACGKKRSRVTPRGPEM